MVLSPSIYGLFLSVISQDLRLSIGNIPIRAHSDLFYHLLTNSNGIAIACPRDFFFPGFHLPSPLRVSIKAGSVEVRLWSVRVQVPDGLPHTSLFKRRLMGNHEPFSYGDTKGLLIFGSPLAGFLVGGCGFRTRNLHPGKLKNCQGMLES